MSLNKPSIKNEVNMEPTKKISSNECECAESGLKNLFIDQLKDLFNAENQLVKALPKMAKAANSPKLKSAFTNHLKVTEGHINRLEEILTKLDEKPGGKTCKAMQGLVEEGKEAIEQKEEDAKIKDAGLIAAARRVEHYEMAGYNVVYGYAQKLGLNEAAKSLQKTLQEEEQSEIDLTLLSNELLANAG
jgi:ferritin-like metal-binding protein YciE